MTSYSNDMSLHLEKSLVRGHSTYINTGSPLSNLNISIVFLYLKPFYNYNQNEISPFETRAPIRFYPLGVLTVLARHEILVCASEPDLLPPPRPVFSQSPVPLPFMGAVGPILTSPPRPYHECPCAPRPPPQHEALPLVRPSSLYPAENEPDGVQDELG
jgi:hypothetical protein